MQTYKIREMSWTEFDERRKQTNTVIIPTGACEIYGPHLPMGSDGFAAEAVSERVAERTGCGFDGYYALRLPDLLQIGQAEGVVTIKAAPQALDGLLVSFANEKDAGRILSIAYAGKTYDNQGDNTKSTIHGATAKQKIALAFYEATNEMNGYYCGPFVDVQ